MTLIVMLTTGRAAYMSADFRLTYRNGRYIDDPPAQKLVPVYRPGWAALVGFTGVAKLPRLVVEDWLAETVQGLGYDSDVDELERRLLEADSWLVRVPRAERRHTFAAAGFAGSTPFALLASNFQTIDGRENADVADRLFVSKRRSGSPKAFAAGDRSSVTPETLRRLRAAAHALPIDHIEIHNALARANETAAASSRFVSTACFTARIERDGHAEAMPHGIPADVEFIPSFAREAFAQQGAFDLDRLLKPTLDEQGQPKKRLFVGMTAARSEDRNTVAWLYVFRNVEDPDPDAARLSAK